MQTKAWVTSGGKTAADFHLSADDKYVFKEVSKREFKMFCEFAGAYFDYMARVLFENVSSALAKILGAFVIKSKVSGVLKKQYAILLENLNLGISPDEEEHTIRYDLKGSEMNRFVKQDSSVLLDSNFLFEYCGRPIVIDKRFANLLHISLNNDTLCLSKD